jgi:hypothetical protein
MVSLKPRYIIASPSYNSNSGGIMVLHQFCHLLNEISEAYLVPMPRGTVINWLNLSKIDKIIEEEKAFVNNKFIISPDLNTPVFSGNLTVDNCVAVYPEVVFGNPFGLKNIARWVLYHSGFHRKMNCTSYGEVEFKFDKNYNGSAIQGFSETSDIILNIFMPRKIHYQTLKNNVEQSMDNLLSNRKGTAYIIRKGKFYPHPLISEDSICVDGKNADEIMEIMKKVKHFVSFDPYTYYSTIAVVYGCYSLILPPLNQSKKELINWKKRFKTEPWSAFCEDKLELSWDNRWKLLKHFDDSLRVSKNNVERFHNFWTAKINGKDIDLKES